MGMISFKRFIEERFVNALPKDDEIKAKHADKAWELLQKSYAPIGGIKGKGFNSKDDMMKIPFWKMIVQNGELKGIVFYKDKGGRKSVAVGTDGSDYAKAKVADIMKNDVKRSYGEKSKAALGTMMKQLPWDVLQQFTKTPEEAAKILKKDDVVGVRKYKGEMPKDAEQTLQKYPELKDYAYIRDIGGVPTFKVMFGTPGKSIR